MLRVIRSIAYVACAAAALAGCIKLRQRTAVMPDGSGKLTMTVGFSKAITSMAKSMGGKEGAAKDPFADMNTIPKEQQGFVAFTKPEKSEKEGFTFFTFTGYFEDINKVQMGKP